MELTVQKNNRSANAVTKIGRALGPVLALAAAANFFGASIARADVYLFNTLIGNAVALDHMDAAGNIYIADGGDHTVRKATAGGIVTTLAGGSGQGGSADVTGTNARFVYPYAVAVDAAGNVYVTDIGNQNIRKITAGGVVTTLAGTVGVAGSVGGNGTAAQFNLAQGIAVDATGNLYVSDTNNSTIRRIAPNGAVTTLAGVAGQTGSADGTGAGATFNFPFGLAVDATGNIYAADYGNSEIRRISSGGTVTTFAGSASATGTADGQGGSARFDH